MPACTVHAVQWKNRTGYRISNQLVEVTILLGGGHIADFRFCHSPVNVIWEAPWPTVEPQISSTSLHATTYGGGPVGKLLSGYTGHLVAVPFFGMPSESEAQQGLALHGEAATSAWTVAALVEQDQFASLVVEVELPVSHLRLRRKLTLSVGSTCLRIDESVLNNHGRTCNLQWVQHATFGEPLLAAGSATVYCSAKRGIVWPDGYEGRGLLKDNAEFTWPFAPSSEKGSIDLSKAFTQRNTGFVAAVLADSAQTPAYALVVNKSIHLLAGYVFDGLIFPWIALWEENCARQYPPWNGITRVRGIEFGTSPFPLGLEQSQQQTAQFDTPTFMALPPHAQLTTRYHLLVNQVPESWAGIREVVNNGKHLVVSSESGDEIRNNLNP